MTGLPDSNLVPSGSVEVMVVGINLAAYFFYVQIKVYVELFLAFYVDERES